MMCRHCLVRKGVRPRVLCGPCYYSPVRALYPVVSKYAIHGVGGSVKRPPLPEPTGAAVGSNEKIAVLAARAEAGEQLFHPKDSRRVVPESAYLVRGPRA